MLVASATIFPTALTDIPSRKVFLHRQLTFVHCTSVAQVAELLLTLLFCHETTHHHPDIIPTKLIQSKTTNQKRYEEKESEESKESSKWQIISNVCNKNHRFR